MMEIVAAGDADISLTLYKAECDLADVEDSYEYSGDAGTALVGVHKVLSLLQEAIVGLEDAVRQERR